MIIVPEIETVVILTPRTGTTALKDAVLATYPRAMQIYRHMEADGVPQGYDRWPKVGIVRDPVDRLWSLYKYLQRFGTDYATHHDEAFTASQRQSVARPFDQWLVENEVVFTAPYDRSGLGRFFPAYAVRHPLPENRKSQFVYLRPDLGTEIYRYDEAFALFNRLGVSPGRSNMTSALAPPPLSGPAFAYVQRWFAWDIEASGGAA